ncbi:MAG: hypothetical protein HWE27_12065 [Gammaproteobacteria bacterium]|nr:hypothetical protein [Gammaproteobacteria bacterium]
MTVANGSPNDNSFFTWNEFVEEFGAQLDGAQDVYLKMQKEGLKPNALLKFDVHFLCDDKINADRLSTFIKDNYQYTIESVRKEDDKIWAVNGISYEFPVTSDNLMYWILDMYKRGYGFDCKLDGYGAPMDVKNQKFPDLSVDKVDYYFDLGVDRYNTGDLSGAIINWSNLIEINDKDASAYYSRAVVKDELYTWKSALRDYDKAIELNPDFISALLNRGSLKDENEDFDGAIADYLSVINNKKSDKGNLQKAYFNKGNTYLELKQIKKACGDWSKARELGADYAQERISKYCTKNE